MTAPPKEFPAEEYGDTPYRLGVYPMDNGDFQILFRERVTEKWIVVLAIPRGYVPEEFESQVIPLAPTVQVPDDLADQFRKQLGLKDGE